MPPAAYLQMVAATNFKQRVRKMMEYYHADRLNYAVAGTPNRLEYDQGFFVKLGDGAADIKPIAHLYKTQVYALAEYLGVPEEIRRRPPTTDTFSLPQTQEEFYFALPYAKMDLCLYGHNHGVPPAEVAAGDRPDRRAGRARLPRHRSEAPHHALPARAAAAGRARRGGHRLMCGIAGVVHRARRPAAARRSTSSRRWPARSAIAGRTSSASTATDRAGLAHARLSIIDLATGQQPLSNETRHAVGRLQRRDLQLRRAARRARGARPPFRTRSDTEVIVHAYEEWGDEAFRRFNGQWAIALWDAERAELVLARDPFGVRPLYVAEHGGRLYFASEVKAIFAADPVAAAPLRSRRPRPASSRSGRTVAPQTVFEGIEELEPGTRARLSRRRRRARIARYDPAFPDRRDAAVPRHARRRGGRGAGGARATRPACGCCAPTCRSAAICPAGSTARSIAALGLRAKGAKFSTFSLRFEDAEYDETAYQRAMAEHLGSDHHEVLVSRGDIARVFPDVDPPHRAAGAAHGAGAAVPAVAARARRGHQGRADRRGRRRDVRRLRPLPRGQGPAVLGAAAGLRRGGRGCSSGSIRISSARRWRSARWRGSSSASGLDRCRDAGLRPRAALARRRGAEAPVLGRPARRGSAAPTPARRCSAGLPAAFARWSAARAGPVPRGPHAALRLPAVVAGRPDADGALGRGTLPVPRSATSPRSPSRCRRRTSCACSTRSTCSSARPRDLVPRGDPRRARSSRTARRTRCRSPADEAREWIDEVASAARARRGRRLRRRPRSRS